jgi:hypothetical protein
VGKGKCVIWNTYERRMVSPEHDIKLYETTTLSGRPIRLLAESRQALNYQDQGTGADILARAIASLPEEIAAMMLMPVHDELVFEVPANEPMKSSKRSKIRWSARLISCSVVWFRWRWKRRLGKLGRKSSLSGPYPAIVQTKALLGVVWAPEARRMRSASNF